MDLKLLSILRCPACKHEFTCQSDEKNQRGGVIKGKLICKNCIKEFPIINAIPRFIAMDNYASSFGYQWNLYKYTQVDRYSKIMHSEKRFFAETGWNAEALHENWVLDVGCGNGRFVEVCARANCQVIGVDISSAIDAAGELFKDKENIHLVQASIYELPFAETIFDKCYCIGVIQHTPDNKKSVKCLPKFLKKGGELALTVYERKPWTKFNAKYGFRLITPRLKPQTLLFLIKILSPLLFVLTEILYRIPVLKKIFKMLIPYANYVEMKELSFNQRYEWAILDTFDMLSPAYDQPMTEPEIRAALADCGIKNISRLNNPGLNIIAIK